MFDNFIGDKRPLSWALQFWPVLVLSFVFAFAATWLCRKIALKLGIVDKPDNKVKTHKEPIAYLGGIGIFTGLAVGTLAGIYCLNGQEYFAGALKWLLGILAGAAIACFTGVIDDIFDLNPKKKFLGEMLTAVPLIIVGIIPAVVYSADYSGSNFTRTIEWILAVFITLFFVLSSTNSLNLLDGLDGLCGGVTAVIVFAQLILAVHISTWNSSDAGNAVRIIICLGLLGGICGFLPFNRHPAKIFMGDAGSVMLGFTTAAIMILFAENEWRWWMASIIIFALPILDTATALVRRILNKRPLFVSDRGHIYDQMIDRGISLNKTVNICYLISAVYGLIGVTFSLAGTIYALIAYAAVFAASGIVIWRMGFLEMEGLRGAHRKQQDNQTF